jgi:hypothetical protein
VTTAAVSARRTRVGALVAAVPVWGWIGVIYVLSVGFRFGLSLRIHAPWIFQDEAVYADLARSLGQHGHFAIRQLPGTSGFGVLYPALIAPAWAIFSAPPDAYVAAKLINALLMSLAIVPAFLIARRLMRPHLAVIAAAFAVAIPSLAYVNTLLTENAFYPAAMAAVAALFLLLERPTLLPQVSFFVFTVLAFLIRAQGVILLGAFVLAVAMVCLVNAWVESRFRPRVFVQEMLRFRVSLVIFAAAIVAVVVYETARGRHVTSVLGTYRGVTAMHHPLSPTLRWTIEHFGELDLYVAVIPFIAMVIIVGLGLRPAERSAPMRAFAASSLGLVLVFVATAAIYATDVQGQRIEERYMFHVAPLFFVALLAWIDRGLPRPPVLTGVGVALGAGLAGAVQYNQLITSDVVHDAFGLVPLLSLELKGTLASQSVGVAVSAAAITAGIVVVLVRQRIAWILPALVLVYYGVIVLNPIQHRIMAASRDALGAGITVRRDWVDSHVGAKTNVALLVNGGPTALPYWENEFFNKSVRTVFTLAGPYDSLPRTDVAPAPSGVLRDTANQLVRHRYVLSNFQVVPAGRPIASDPGTGMTLYQTKGPLRLKGTLLGIYPDRWSGGAALWTQYGCRGGTLTTRVRSDSLLFRHGVQTIRANLGGKTIARISMRAGRPTTFAVPLPEGQNVCAVNFIVRPTAVPAQVIPGLGDQRMLGTRFLDFDYKPG